MQETQLISTDYGDPFQSAFCEKLNCYCYESEESLARFGIVKGSLLFAELLESQPSDLVICMPLYDRDSLYFGRLIRKTNSRIILEMYDGIEYLIITNALLVVVRIA